MHFIALKTNKPSELLLHALQNNKRNSSTIGYHLVQDSLHNVHHTNASTYDHTYQSTPEKLLDSARTYDSPTDVGVGDVRFPQLNVHEWGAAPSCGSAQPKRQF